MKHVRGLLHFLNKDRVQLFQFIFNQRVPQSLRIEMYVIALELFREPLFGDQVLETHDAQHTVILILRQMTAIFIIIIAVQRHRGYTQIAHTAGHRLDGAQFNVFPPITSSCSIAVVIQVVESANGGVAVISAIAHRSHGCGIGIVGAAHPVADGG